MGNQIQTAIELRDRATQVALNFVGHRISSSDGSYELLIDSIAGELAEIESATRKACAEIAREIADQMNGVFVDARGDYTRAARAMSARDTATKIERQILARK